MGAIRSESINTKPHRIIINKGNNYTRITNKSKMIKKFIDSIAIDKKDHILLGLIIGFPLILLFGNLGGYIAIILVAAKEVVNDLWLGKGNPEWLDFIASAIPIIMFMIFYNL